ncbi:hypothetical protein [Anaerolentibacter hominis]|uniref:hypothetical protein n=1 Tax=Anaerolentibacter hominis TaxID=3079009 RepID=UPI0031B812F6
MTLNNKVLYQNIILSFQKYSTKHPVDFQIVEQNNETSYFIPSQHLYFRKLVYNEPLNRFEVLTTWVTREALDWIKGSIINHNRVVFFSDDTYEPIEVNTLTDKKLLTESTFKTIAPALDCPFYTDKKAYSIPDLDLEPITIKSTDASENFQFISYDINLDGTWYVVPDRTKNPIIIFDYPETYILQFNCYYYALPIPGEYRILVSDSKGVIYALEFQFI